MLIKPDVTKIISKGNGFRNVESKEKNTLQTIIEIGSLTMQFIVSAILKLKMQSKLGTSDNISKYFQNVPVDKSAITSQTLTDTGYDRVYSIINKQVYRQHL